MIKTKYSFLFSVLFFGLLPLSGFSQTILNSLPGSTSVLYLDFDGHSDNSGWWSSATFPDPIVTAASTYSSARITEVFNRVAEDYRPFNLNVTTDAAVYNAAATAKRQRVVFTASSQFYTDENGGAGGVAYLNTFGGGEIACYVFTNFLGSTAKNAAEAAAHEAGHTLGLNHHSRFNSDCTNNTEYHNGQGSGQSAWCPIMGASYSAIISQWYTGGSNGTTCTSEIQDDLSVITTNNGFSFRTDDFGNTLATAGNLTFTGTAITQKGIITTTADIDVFKITVTITGVYSFGAQPNAISTTTNSGANLDVKMWLANASGTILNTANDTTRLNATLSPITCTAGTYYVYIEGTGIKGFKDIGGNGTFDYGSLGEYTLTINRLCTPVITSTTPASRCDPGMAILKATTSDGTINWYATSTSTTILGSGASFTSPSLFATTTYFVGATATGCGTNATRVPVVATIGTPPVANAGTDKTFAQNAGNQTLVGTPSGGTWSGTGVTSAGIFNPNQTPGTYLVQYCASSNNCTDCDSLLITITGSPTQASAPTITPGTGTYTTNQTVSLSSATPDATIYYTLTGNTPAIGTGFTKVYNGPFVLTQTTTVKAMAVKSGLTNSPVTSTLLTINNATIVATPVIDPPTGSYSGQKTVVITCPTSGASIFYTTNGNVPSTSVNSFTKLYAGSFSVNATTTIRAIGVKTGLTTSAVAVSAITITTPTLTVATPVISPGTGSYSAPQVVSIGTATPGATLYYTTSGNTPVVGTSFTKLYSGPFSISSTTTIRAMGVATGQINSSVAVANLTLTGARANVAEPNANLEEEAYKPETNKVFPNPTRGVVFIEDLESNIQGITIFDSKGQQQAAPAIEKVEGRFRLDLTNLRTGFYLVQLASPSGFRLVKVVKQD